MKSNLPKKTIRKSKVKKQTLDAENAPIDLMTDIAVEVSKQNVIPTLQVWRQNFSNQGAAWQVGAIDVLQAYVNDTNARHSINHILIAIGKLLD